MALNVSKICFNCKPTNQQTKYLKQYLKEAKYKSIKSGHIKECNRQTSKTGRVCE